MQKSLVPVWSHPLRHAAVKENVAEVNERSISFDSGICIGQGK
jgi:hypothetical protein